MINIDTQQPIICTHPQSIITNQAGLTSVSHQLHCKQVNKACAPQMIKVKQSPLKKCQAGATCKRDLLQILNYRPLTYGINWSAGCWGLRSQKYTAICIQ